jgi:hypothetical protein
VPIVAGGGYRRSGDGVVREPRRAGGARHALGRSHSDQGASLAIAPPFGVSLLDLPTHIPLPAKITVEVLPPIDRKEQFGAAPEHDQVYDKITAEMQEALSELQDERTLPVVG